MGGAPSSPWSITELAAEARLGSTVYSEQMGRRASAGDMDKGAVHLEGVCDILKSLTYVIRIRRQGYRKWVEAIFKEIMAKKFLKLKKNLCSQIQDAQENHKPEEHKTYLGVSECKLLQTKKKNLKCNQRKGQITFKRMEELQLSSQK